MDDDLRIKNHVDIKFFGLKLLEKIEMLNIIDQTGNATRTLNVLLWSKHIALNANKRIFCTGLDSVLSYCWVDSGLHAEQNVKYRSGALKRSCKNMQNIKGKERRNRMEITQTALERMENNTLNSCGHSSRMEGDIR